MVQNKNFFEICKFQPKQLEAMRNVLEKTFFLYGGAAGGGKSYFLRWTAVYLCMYYFAKYKIPNVRVGLFCEDYPSLKERQLTKVEFEFPAYLGKLNKTEHEFRLAEQYGGGVIAFRNLDDPSKYLSSEFACVAQGTPILMDDGNYKAIEKIAVGDKVMTLAGPRMVKNTWGPRLKECVRAEVRDGSGNVIGSQVHPKSHRILTNDGWHSYETLLSLSNESDVSGKSALLPDSQSHVFSQVHETQCLDSEPLLEPIGLSLDHSDCKEFSASSKDNQSYSVESCDEHLENRPLPALSCRVVLHEPAFRLNGTPRQHHPPFCVRDDESLSCEAQGFPRNYSECFDQRGEQPHPKSKNVQSFPPSLVDAVQHIREKCNKDDPDTLPSHSHTRTFEYDHPYTRVRGLASEGVQFGTCIMAPCGVKEVYDLTIEDQNHYIGSSKLCNTNSILVDELTRNPKETFDFLNMRRRWPGLKDTKFIGATNPGGVGHAWVKKLWISRDFKGETLNPVDFSFTPARAIDNSYLGLDYENQLNQLPEKLRKAYKDGDWDVFKGQFFAEWNSSIHVIPPFDIPTGWTRIRCLDYGFKAPSACYWLAIDYDNKVYVYRELHEAGLTYSELAKKIVAMTPQDEIIDYTVADTSMFAQTLDTGEYGSDIMADNGCPITPATKDRIPGWNLFRKRLREVSILFFSSCHEAIRTIPALVYPEKNTANPEDIDKGQLDHAADAIRYGLMSLPESSPESPHIDLHNPYIEDKDSPWFDN